MFEPLSTRQQRKIRTVQEATLVLIKPDGLQKSLTGNILTRMSETKLVILGTKMKCVSRELAEEHYRHIKDKPFFAETVSYLMGTFHTPRVMALVYYGEDAIKKVREVCGGTNPETASPASIRGSFGRITTKGIFENVIHASTSQEDAEREIKLWFEPDEIVNQKLFPTKEISLSQVKKTVWA